MQTQSTLLLTGWHRTVWIVLLAVASAAFSLGFACAAPLAGFAAAAALTLPRRDAMLAAGLVWYVNQSIGFGVLHYPWAADCLAWGAGLGIVSVLAAFGAGRAAKRFNALPWPLVLAVAFLSAFALYEGLLFAASVVVQSGVKDYTAAIAGRIFAINATAFAGLILASRLRVPAGLQTRSRAGVAGHGQRG